MDIRTYIVYDYREMQRLIKDHYDLSEYNIPSLEESSNDTNLTFIAEPKPLSNELRKMIDNFRGREFNTNYVTRELIDDLCFNGIVQSGNILVEISW